jgi:hypothetical protein
MSRLYICRLCMQAQPARAGVCLHINPRVDFESFEQHHCMCLLIINVLITFIQ